MPYGREGTTLDDGPPGPYPYYSLQYAYGRTPKIDPSLLAGRDDANYLPMGYGIPLVKALEKSKRALFIYMRGLAQANYFSFDLLPRLLFSSILVIRPDSLVDVYVYRVIL
jgi:hypothetical protein